MRVRPVREGLRTSPRHAERLMVIDWDRAFVADRLTWSAGANYQMLE